MNPTPRHPPTVVIATSNPHKVEELRALLAGAACEVIDLAEAASRRGVNLIEPAETGATFEANATIKALSYAAQLGMPCLADDSGLEVDALGGRPGVISSHYATDGRETGLTRPQRDAMNTARVLRELEGEPFERRDARFVCVMVLAAPAPTGPANVVATTRGHFAGRIGVPGDPRFHVPRGAGGFGYDPVFLVAPGFERSAAELSEAEKNAMSHRGAAARAMAIRLRQG